MTPISARVSEGALRRWPTTVRAGLLIAAFLSSACGGDASTVEGALARAASAVGARDHEALFSAIDQRSRFALSSVYNARKQAAKEIRASYPQEAQHVALAELGDAVDAESDVDLFRLRCADACLDAFAATLGAPTSVELDGKLATVTTVRGTKTLLYRGEDGKFGLVWETAALVRERTRAAAELDLIRKNGQQYRSQRALEGVTH
jgi:hypothetical protein